MSNRMSRGFTLLGVLVAALLVAIPVGSAQMLMLHSTGVVHGAQGHAFAWTAARLYVARALAFHLGGFWPESFVSQGYWLPGIWRDKRTRTFIKAGFWRRGGGEPSRQVVAVSRGKPAGNCRSVT
ncbi:MAG: hypothetical protein VXZ19_02785 [Pseudomonadota bacterium]|nr:hypothetical protein [Pseudomonadota bacterium]